MKRFRKEQQKKEQLRAERRQAFYSSSKSGFTIIELTLSMAFVGVLLITIAIIITNITAIYQKGLALKAVNSVGRSLTDEFTRAVSQGQAFVPSRFCDLLDSSVKGACEGENAKHFVYQEVTGQVTDPVTGNSTDQQLGGIFCTGDYSYIWNTKQGLAQYPDNGVISLEYFDEVTKTDITYADPIHLIRVDDSKSRVCSAMVDVNYDQLLQKEYDDSGPVKINITKNVVLGDGEGAPSTTSPYEIKKPTSGFLSDFDLTLELYQLRIFDVSVEKMRYRRFMSGTFILGTKTGGINIARGGDYCDVTDGSLQSLSSDFNYCAINKFNFAARTAGVSDENIGK